MSQEEPHITVAGDRAFLERTRAETQAHLDMLMRWTDLMRSVVDSMPPCAGSLPGVSTAEARAILADESSAEHLRTLLREIDRRIAMLTLAQSSSRELPAQSREPAA